MKRKVLGGKRWKPKKGPTLNNNMFLDRNRNELGQLSLLNVCNLCLGCTVNFVVGVVPMINGGLFIYNVMLLCVTVGHIADVVPHFVHNIAERKDKKTLNSCVWA